MYFEDYVAPSYRWRQKDRLRFAIGSVPSDAGICVPASVLWLLNCHDHGVENALGALGADKSPASRALIRQLYYQFLSVIAPNSAFPIENLTTNKEQFYRDFVRLATAGRASVGPRSFSWEPSGSPFPFYTALGNARRSLWKYFFVVVRDLTGFGGHMAGCAFAPELCLFDPNHGVAFGHDLSSEVVIARAFITNASGLRAKTLRGGDFWPVVFSG